MSRVCPKKSIQDLKFSQRDSNSKLSQKFVHFPDFQAKNSMVNDRAPLNGGPVKDSSPTSTVDVHCLQFCTLYIMNDSFLSVMLTKTLRI